MMDNSVSSNGFPGSSAGSVPVGTNSPSGRTNSSFSYKGASRALGVTAFLALLAASLLFLLPGGPLHAQEAAIMYAENGTGAVATLTAVDPEGESIVWSSGGCRCRYGGLLHCRERGAPHS